MKILSFIAGLLFSINLYASCRVTLLEIVYKYPNFFQSSTSHPPEGEYVDVIFKDGNTSVGEYKDGKWRVFHSQYGEPIFWGQRKQVSGWNSTTAVRPPEGVLIEWIDPVGDIVFGKFRQNAFFPDGSSMYIYYRPVMWRTL